jgi:hypothetical protein
MANNQRIAKEQVVKPVIKMPKMPVTDTALHSTVRQPADSLQRVTANPDSLPHTDILQLQRTLGNRAVGALLGGSTAQRPVIQAKLTVSTPGDRFEQEADRVAEQVMRMPTVQQTVPGEETNDPAIKPLSALQRKGDGAIEVDDTFERQLRANRGLGQVLPSSLRHEFEGKFGTDFSGVRIHADAQADQLNRSIQAKAFTTGQHVFFRQGAYEPGSRGGQALLAHELTHVVQQNSGAVQRVVQREVYLDQRGVSSHYTYERTIQRPDLLGAITAVIDKLKQVNREYEAKRLTGITKLQLLGKEREKLYEFLRLQDVDVDKKGNLAPDALKHRLVEYDETPGAQKKTLVNISGGKLQRNYGWFGSNTPVDTSGSVTFQTGKGWEIFVMSPTGDLHMASHKIGKYHHSSLLAGGPTAAAGSIKATSGKIEALNNKSGHYQPGPAQMRQALHRLQKAGVSLDFNLDILGKPIDEFTGKAADYMKSVNAGGKGGMDDFEFGSALRILHHFIAIKGVAAVRKAFTDIGWDYQEPLGRISITKNDGSLATHEEVRNVLTAHFHEPGPVDVKK